MRHHIVFLLCLSVFLISTSVAQPQGRIEQTMKELTEKIALTSQQQDTVRQILEGSAADMREARQMASGDREDMMELMRTIQGKADAKIEAVLTADQKPEYEKYKEERKKRMEERRNDGGMRPRGRP